MSKKIVSAIEKKKFYTFWIIMVPSILMPIVSMGIPDFLIRTLAQVTIFALQAVVVKGILDDYFRD